MSIDLQQFHETFFEESFEGLDIMESGLLQLEQGEVDMENINTIFRSAHSIKGGSGTFGFSAVADFTHDMETLLDQMRNGERQVSAPVVNTLLGCVDVLRNMLHAIKDGDEIDSTNVAQMTSALKDILGEDSDAASTAGTTEAAAAQGGSGWNIIFKPHAEIMQSGNDTVRLLRELCELSADYEVVVNNDALPALAELDPEACYQSWCIQLKGDGISEADIRDVFAWVDDECDLSIEAINDGASDSEAERGENKSKSADAVANEQRQLDRRQGERRGSSRSGESSSIRVNISKVDELINMVGELVITQSMLSQFGEDDNFNESHIERLKDGLAQLESHTRELQESVMRIRMMPISFAFQRFPRLVHDLSAQFGKNIELVMTGEATELDKTVLEKIGDPLVHLVRNSLDHGIEMPDVRRKAGKPESGMIKLGAYHQGGNIVIEIKDDGAGLNREKILSKAKQNGLIGEDDRLTDEQIDDLIFRPGFSTADVVSDVSGRGVGMDVVRRNIRELGGTVEVVSTPGQGSVFTIRLPLTLAILDGQLVGIGNETYILPVISIIESLQVKAEHVNAVAGRAEVYRLRNEYIPIVRLYDIFGIEPLSTSLNEGLLVVVEAESRKIAIFVDELQAQQQVVIKSLETNFKKVRGLSGATILGNGTVALIIDIAGLIELYQGDMGGSDADADTVKKAASPPEEKIMSETAEEFVHSDLQKGFQELLTFFLAGEEYGVNILRVQEIKGWDAVTNIPNTPEYIRGVINIRGSIVPIIDMRLRFKLEKKEYDATTVVIVLNVKSRSGKKDRTMGIVVDAVSDVYNVPDDEVKAAPDFGSAVDTAFVTGLATIEDKMIIVLDIDQMLNAAELAVIEEISE